MACLSLIALFASLFVAVSADCGGLSPSLCAQLNKATHSLTSAFESANDALANAMSEAAQKRSLLFQASLTIARAHIPQQQHTTLESVAALQSRLSATITETDKAQQQVAKDALQAFEDASSEIQTVLQETIIAARRSDSGAAQTVAFAISGNSQTLESIKQKLEDALKKAKGKVRVIIQKAIERINQGVQKVEGFLAKILGEAGVQKVRELLQTQVERLLKAIDEALAKQAAKQSEASFNVAVKDTEDLIDELEQETRVTRRSIGDIWAKVKAAVSKLGASIREAAAKAIEVNKPKILKALQDTGRVVIQAGRDIILEIVNSAVNAIVPGKSTTA